MTIQRPGRNNVKLVSESLQHYADTNFTAYVHDIDDAYEIQADSVIIVSDDGFLRVSCS